MTLRDLADLAWRTRQAQKRYFATRERLDLEESKRLERDLDLTVTRIRNGADGEGEAGEKQGHLFMGEM